MPARTIHSSNTQSVDDYVKAVLESCDLVYVLAEGKVLAQGTPNEVATDPEVRARYLGTRIDYAQGQGLSAAGTGRHAGSPARQRIKERVGSGWRRYR